MASFVLVHGSGQNATCWSRVGRSLTARGHEVAAPDLPKQATEWGLEDHAAWIAESVQGAHSVVVAHSFCGTLLPLVPPIRDCGLLVFLAAVIPEPGKSVRDQFTEDPSMFSSSWIAAGARWFDAAEQESLAREFLFHDCDEDAIAWGLETIEAIDTKKLVTQPAPFTEWPSVPTASIVATGDRTLSPEWGKRTSRRALGVESIEVQSGHSPFVSMPQELAELLERLATTDSSSTDR